MPLKEKELWDVYDADMNRHFGVSLVRGEEIPDGMYHLVCDVLVKHVDGTFLVMQRHKDKHLGGWWEATAGGSALLGETPFECARRELAEETGIRTDSLTEVGRLVRPLFHTISVLYMTTVDVPKDSVRLQDGETTAYKWISEGELRDPASRILGVVTKCVPDLGPIKQRPF